jgi:hypothetical protein
MAPTEEKNGVVANHASDEDLRKVPVVKEANVASVALAEAFNAHKPSLLSRNMLQLYAIMGVGYLVSTMNGFDSSLMGAINAMPSYQKTFGLSGAGSTTGIIFIIYNLGQIAAFPCWYALPLTPCFNFVLTWTQWLPRRRLWSQSVYLRWLRSGFGW